MKIAFENYLKLILANFIIHNSLSITLLANLSIIFNLIILIITTIMKLLF